MIIETKVYSCRKCQSEDLVKNGTNASSSSQYKRLSMKDPVCAGLNRRLGISRRTLSAWLKEQANDLPPLEETLQPAECKKIPVLDVDELWSFIFRSKDKVWVWIAMNREIREIVASTCGDRSENTCRIGSRTICL